MDKSKKSQYGCASASSRPETLRCISTFYHNGKRSYEYLNLYLVPEDEGGQGEEQGYPQTRGRCPGTERVVEFQNGRFGFDDGYKLDTNFLDYCRMMCEKRGRTPPAWGTGATGAARSGILRDTAAPT